MIDREKAVKGLTLCIADGYCNDCPYEEGCFDEKSHMPFGKEMMRDALALLKEQEAKVLQVRSWKDEYYGTVAFCPKCECQWIMANDEDLHFCPKCGQAVRWK